VPLPNLRRYSNRPVVTLRTIARLKSTAVAVLAACCVCAACANSNGPAPAGTTPAPATVVPPDKGIDIYIEELIVRWKEVPEAARYALDGHVTVFREPAAGDPACLYPVETQESIAIDRVTIDGQNREYPLPLAPPPPGEQWSVKDYRLDVRAFDANDNELAHLGSASTADNFCG